MPLITCPDGAQLQYTLDDYSGAWTKPATVLFVHRLTAFGDAWQAAGAYHAR